MNTQTVNGVEIIRGLDIEEYHKSPILSHTKIHSWIENSPEWWKARFVDGQREEKEAEHFVVGRALDCLMFDGKDAFADCFVTSPATYPAVRKATKAEIAAGWPAEITEQKKWTLSANYCKEWEETARAEGKSVVTSDQMRMIHAEAAAIARNKFAREVLRADGAEYQVTLRWRIDGIWFQARPDIINFKNQTFDDLKTTRSLDTVAKHYFFMGYDIQTGLIMDAMSRIFGTPPARSRHIYVDKSFYPTCVVQEVYGPIAGPSNGEYGLARAVKIAREIEACRSKGVFERPQREILPLVPPEWIQRKITAGEELHSGDFMATDDAAETLERSM